MVEIKLDGKTFPIRATMRAWRKFEDATGKKVADVDSNDVTLIPELVYYFVRLFSYYHLLLSNIVVYKYLIIVSI